MTERKTPDRKRPKKPPAGDYEVGYGKPPVATQFKKGEPRPPRKPKSEKAAPTFEDYLAEVFLESMRIVENGVAQVVPKGKALAKAAVNVAIKEGDPRRLKGHLPQRKVNVDFDFSETDLAIVARFLAQAVEQFASLQPEAGDSDTLDEEAGE